MVVRRESIRLDSNVTTEICYWFFCFVPQRTMGEIKIFGFAEFLTAVALLAILYTVVDVRYKFRIAVAPGPIYLTTFVLITVIGLQTLLTQVWVVEGWWVPRTIGLTYSIWQGIFGLMFLGTFLTWMYYAFIRPPIFGPRNALRFGRELYRYILRGNDEELKVIANELARSAKNLIKYSRGLRIQKAQPPEADRKKKPDVANIAHDILLLIANRRFCRLVVSASPVTAQVIFEDAAAEGKFYIPIGQFARNITSEAVAQKGSFLYEESEGYTTGLLGYLKPVTHAVYGNSGLVEALATNGISPLDVNFEEQWAWDAKQWEAYCRATLITLKDNLENGSSESFALNRAMHDIESAYRDLHKLNDAPSSFSDDAFERFRVAVDFVKQAIDLIDKLPTPPKPLRRVREGTYPKNVYDHLALMIFDMCFAAATVHSPPDTCWGIHYNTLWSSVFSGFRHESKAWKIVQFKVRRILYDEIASMVELPNYKGSRILGLCLNVMGMRFEKSRKDSFRREEYALAKVVQNWARKHYLAMRKEYPDVADSVLIGSVSFDSTGNRLVKTYIKGLNREAPKEYLDLE